MKDYPGPTTFTTLSRYCGIFVPDILSTRKTSPSHLSSTAWLDGLRGWAALCVTFAHLTIYTHEGLELCYGYKYRHRDEHNVSPVALPILRLPFTGGHFSVMLFFVISGYVVPRRLLQQLQEGRRQDFLESLHSAMIRRPVRLFLPVILSTLAFLMTWHLFGVKVLFLKQQDDIISELWTWVQQSVQFTYFHRTGVLYTHYNLHSWTIPVEFRGSMFLFVFLFVVHGISTKTRCMMTLGMIIHLAIGSPGAWYACFFAGMLMSDLDLLAQGTTKVTFAWDHIDQWLRSRKQLRSFVLHSILLVSLYLASQPSADVWTREDTLGGCPGWKTLSKAIPEAYLDQDAQYRWFWLFWSAWMMVYAVREIGWVRRCFETSFAQYLAKHSFSLYLVHGPLLSILSEWLFYLTGVKQAWTDEQKELYGPYQNLWRDAAWWPLPETGIEGLEPNFLFCAAVSIPVMLYVAEVGTRVFDTPSVKLSQRLWQKWKTL